MNDPGLDAPIAKHAKAVEQVDGGGEEDEAIDDEDEAFREPRSVLFYLVLRRWTLDG